MAISESYASPGLRWGLLLEDQPGATYTFELLRGVDFPVNPIPEGFGGDRDFCVCTITFPPETGKSAVSAYKPAGAQGDPEGWNVTCTKTLGRALKKAGYPDDLKDLKALLLWRQRTAETQAIMSGSAHLALDSGEPAPQRALPAAPVEDALDEAAVSNGERVSGDDAGDDEPVDAEVVEDRSETVEELVEGLSDKEFENYKGFLETIGAPVKIAEMSENQLDDVLSWLDPDGKAA